LFVFCMVGCGGGGGGGGHKYTLTSNHMKFKNEITLEFDFFGF